jgi:hypothetical protein
MGTWGRVWKTLFSERPPMVEPRNGVSSFHMWWQGFEGGSAIVDAAATLTVLEEPTADRLYFWALQSSFLDGTRSFGAGHIGLQWNPRHPDSRAVNWGGYANIADVQSVLRGTPSPLPSTPNDPNTRDYRWRAGAGYRFRIAKSPHGWRGEITDVERGETTIIRELDAPGDRLGGFVVWSEVFAACSHPPAIVEWSDLSVRSADGEVRRPTSVRLTFPSGGDCPNTDVRLTATGLRQLTNTSRTARDGQVLPVPDG